MSTVRRRMLAWGGVAALAFAASTGPAAADTRDHSTGHHRHGSHHRPDFVQPPTPYSFTEDFDPGCAGLDVAGHFEITGVTSIRRAPGTGGQGFLLKDSYRFSETWRAGGTGEVIFRISGQYVFEERRATLVPNDQVPAELIPPGGLVGPVYRFTVTETGHDTLRDGSGKVRYRTAGVQVFENLFDTLGDSAVGGVSLSFTTVKVIGPHPLLDADLCDVAAELSA